MPRPPKATPPNVIALSSYRERLARERGSRRADALFDSPDPEGAIRALPPDEFFYVIHELGFPEAMEVLVHGTAEQVQTVLDFSLWEGDRVSMDKADDWLAALAEAPPKALGQWAQGIDVELLAFLVRQRTLIHDLSLEEEPEDTEEVLWHTPDRLFAIELLGEAEQVRVTQHLLDSLYRYSPDMMRRLLVGIRAESDAEMEETAFRWRSGRMADLGFADFYEAMAVYQELDPAKVAIGAGQAPSSRPKGQFSDDPLSRLPAVMSERLSGKTPFARAVAGLTSQEEATDVHFALVALSNRALSADRVRPGDDDAVRGVLERVSATLDLAIEFLARNDLEREVAALRGVPLVTLHRLGASLTGKLRRLALALLHKNPFAGLRPAIDIFESEDAEVLASLSRLRPAFPRLLDTAPSTGGRPFATLADLATATRAIERAAATLDFLAGLGVRPSHLSPESLAAMSAGSKAIDPGAIDTGTLARTVLVKRLLGHPPEPLTRLPSEAVEKLNLMFNSGSQQAENTMLTATRILQSSLGSTPLEGAHREVGLRWLATLHPLGPVLGAGPTSSP